MQTTSLSFTDDLQAPVAEVHFFAVREYSPAGIPTLVVLVDGELASSGEEAIQFLEASVYEYEIIPSVGYGEQSFSLETVGGNARVVRARHDKPLMGTIETGQQVGVMPLILWKNGKVASRKSVEVRSAKIDYRSDYQYMLNDIANYGVSLLLNVRAPARARLTPDHESTDINILQTQFAFLSGLIQSSSFQEALERIFSAAQSSLQPSEAEISINRSKKLPPSFARSAAKGARRLQVSVRDRGYSADDSTGVFEVSLPERFPDNQKSETFDTPENQFIKYALTSFYQTLETLKQRLLRGSFRETSLPERAPEIDHFQREINSLQADLEITLAHRLFAQLSPLTRIPYSSPVLQRKHGYKEVYQAWLTYELAMKLQWTAGADVFGAGKKDTALLYEYWLFFMLLQVLSELGTFAAPLPEQLLEERPNGIDLRIRSGNSFYVAGEFEENGLILYFRLYYNRVFSMGHGSWSRVFRPDYTIALSTRQNMNQAGYDHEVRYLHFDAKYRLESDAFLNQDVDTDDDEYGSVDTYKRDDLLKMHSYKDAIPGTLGAYVLYPGTSFSSKLFYENCSAIVPSVGAFPITPHKSEQGLDQVRQFLQSVASYLTEDV